MTLITYADALARVEEAAEGRLDYVNAVKRDDFNDFQEYETCQYPEPAGDAPSCIIGTAFFMEILDAGITPDSEANQFPVGKLFADILSRAGYSVTHRAAAFLAAVQRAQDTGSTWGDAIESGKTTVDDDYRVKLDIKPLDDTVAMLNPPSYA